MEQSLKRYLNIGGRNWNVDEWDNLDYPFERTVKKQKIENITIVHNLMSLKSIQKEDCCYDGIYTSHVIEHLTDSAVMVTFKESYRLLKNGGVFRVTCPDPKKLYDFYKAGDYDKLIIGKNCKLRTPEENLIDMIYTPKRCLASVSRTLDVLKRGGYSDFIALLTPEPVSCEEQASNPGAHINFWEEYRLVTELKTCGFKDVKVVDKGESRINEFMKDNIDNTYPEISIRVECSK